MRDLGIQSKLRNSLHRSTFDAILLTGPDNVLYATGAGLHFIYDPDQSVAVYWPRDGEPVCVSPEEWQGAFRTQGRLDKVVGYTAAAEPFRTLAEVLAGQVGIRTGVVVGIDMARTPHGLLQMLESAMPFARFVPCDGWIEGLRAVKTPSEIELLSQLAYRTDHGIIGAVHHVSVMNPLSEKRLAEEIRVHCQERLVDTVGHHSLSVVASGKHAACFWPLAPCYGLGGPRLPQAGDFVRVETRSSLDGYWCEACRMVVMGEPSREQQEAYEWLVELREAALKYLRPGVIAADLYRALADDALRGGIPLIGGLSVGHGVGITPFEKPFLSDVDETVVEAGMVLIIDPAVRGPANEVLRSADTVIVTDMGCEVVGWFKDWDEPYVTSFTF